MRQKQPENHQRVVRAAARILAFQRWNNDDQVRAVYRQLLLWDDDGEDGETLAPTG